MSTRFSGKVFMVTGASSGIGEVVARGLAADGAHVVLGARRCEKLNAIQAAIQTEGGKASVEALDVTNYEEVEKTVQKIVEEMGRLDGAFNNAGGGGTPATVAESDVVEFKRVFDLNFYGTYHCMKAELQVMTKQGFGSIVNNASILTGQHMPMQSHYGASKAAMKYLQESAALEVAPNGVRVNSVSPGFALPSEALGSFLAQNPHMEPMLKSPQGRMVQAHEVYQAVAFLLDGETSGSVTGADLPVAGGATVNQVTFSKP